MRRLLAVDDEPVNLEIIDACLLDDGYQIDQAEDGEQAWALMQKNSYDLVLLDRMMPTLDGLGLLKRIKADSRWKKLPVIMQTAAAKQQDIRAGLEAGAYYYLTKPYEPEVLRVLVRSVLLELDEHDKLQANSDYLHLLISLLQTGELSFRTLDEARALAATLSHLCADQSATAMGLTELLINAIEHGNLGITYQEKSSLRLACQWESEIEHRLAADPWQTKQARISFRRVEDEIEFTVSDQGTGFDWQPFLEFDAGRAFDLNGRGIAMARMIGFASLEYQGNGSSVVARARSK